MEKGLKGHGKEGGDLLWVQKWLVLVGSGVSIVHIQQLAADFWASFLYFMQEMKLL